MASIWISQNSLGNVNSSKADSPGDRREGAIVFHLMDLTSLGRSGAAQLEAMS